ncbi:CBO0543 family protein [Paenibacillus chartarius]|uniref:CBO0543 family protein n=1 Tax=Paenibacillus chartarius TaxID=747481 RepID=A0ABV6DE60_9BACL
MTRDQEQMLNQIKEHQESSASLWLQYWSQYTNLSTWQFWINVAFLIVPLFVLWKAIDRRKAFEIGFYGFNVHVWFTYIDLFGARHGLWEYPYKMMPFMPVNTALDVSLVPIVYMLMYQWVENHRKNYYLYATAVSLLFAFILKPLITSFDMFVMYKWMNYFYLFLGYMIIALISKGIVEVFRYLKRTSESESNRYRISTLSLSSRRKAR